MVLAKPLGDISEADWARFMTHVQVVESGCWEWTAAVVVGYGQFWLNARGTRAHRVSFAHHKGEPGPAFQIDHLCLNKKCVNPDHLEAVSHRENSVRASAVRFPASDHCVNGHRYADAGYYFMSGRTTPTCKQCKRDVARRHYRARAANGATS